MTVITIMLEMNKDNKYNNIIQDENFYSSKEFYIGYNNYRKSKSGKIDTLDMFVDAIGNSATNALKHGLGLPLDRTFRKLIDDEVKAAAKATGGEWKD